MHARGVTGLRDGKYEKIMIFKRFSQLLKENSLCKLTLFLAVPLVHTLMAQSKVTNFHAKTDFFNNLQSFVQRLKVS